MPSHTTASYLQNESNETDLGFRKITRSNASYDDRMGLLGWLQAQEIVTLEESTANDSAQPPAVKFGLAGMASSHFPILRALIALGRPSTFTIQSDGNKRSFTVRFSADQEAEVKSYLHLVLSLIRAEVRFRQVLRQVLVNQEKFEMEERLLFRNL